MKSYKLIESVLGGIYGAQVGKTDAEANAALKNSLKQDLFRNGIELELKQAFSNDSLSWLTLMRYWEVGNYESEDEAKEADKVYLWDVVFPKE